MQNILKRVLDQACTLDELGGFPQAVAVAEGGEDERVTTSSWALSTELVLWRYPGPSEGAGMYLPAESDGTRGRPSHGSGEKKDSYT